MQFVRVFRIVFILIIIFNSGKDYLSAQVTFSEVMNNPATSEAHDEFVEIYNFSDDAVDLTGWIIADSGGQDLLIDYGRGMLLNPNRYALILDGSYAGNSTTYDAVIPDSVLILQVDGSTIASTLSNSVNRTLLLINALSDTVDSYQYTATYRAGHSNEKIVLEDDNSAQNWGESLFEGGTPGRRNSLSPVQYDLEIGLSLTHNQNNITINTRTEISLSVQNSGKLTFNDSLYILLFIDRNGDSSYSETDHLLFSDNSVVEFQPGEILFNEAEYTYEVSGVHVFVAELKSPSDENPLNNRQIEYINIRNNLGDLCINEIKFLTGQDEPEWVELYNPGPDKFEIIQWAISDLTDTVLIDSAVTLSPGQFKILAAAPGLDTLYSIADSLIYVLKKFPILNNSEDEISLINPLREVVERIPYTINWLEGEDWRHPSLERINPSLIAHLSKNWGPSVNSLTGTPADINSIFTSTERNLKSNVKIEPNPFSPDNDGFEDYTIIHISLPVNTARIKVEIYDIRGRKVRSLSDNTFSGSFSTIPWDGKDDSGRRMRMGVYIAFIRILNDRNGVLKDIKETVVVAGKL
jgi:hypothetical protein